MSRLRRASLQPEKNGRRPCLQHLQGNECSPAELTSKRLTRCGPAHGARSLLQARKAACMTCPPFCSAAYPADLLTSRHAPCRDKLQNRDKEVGCEMVLRRMWQICCTSDSMSAAGTQSVHLHIPAGCAAANARPARATLQSVTDGTGRPHCYCI